MVFHLQQALSGLLFYCPKKRRDIKKRHSFRHAISHQYKCFFFSSSHTRPVTTSEITTGAQV